MEHDIEALTRWIHICLWVASIGATSVPIVYAFSEWNHSRLGKILMLQAIAFALALDITLLFQYWVPTNIMVIFWANAIVFTLIAIATTLLAIKIIYLNYLHRQEKGLRHEQH